MEGQGRRPGPPQECMASSWCRRSSYRRCRRRSSCWWCRRPPRHATRYDGSAYAYDAAWYDATPATTNDGRSIRNASSGNDVLAVATHDDATRSAPNVWVAPNARPAPNVRATPNARSALDVWPTSNARSAPDVRATLNARSAPDVCPTPNARTANDGATWHASSRYVCCPTPRYCCPRCWPSRKAWKAQEVQAQEVQAEEILLSLTIYKEY